MPISLRGAGTGSYPRIADKFHPGIGDNWGGYRLKITISKENYLKSIAEAEAEGETVISATLARWMNVSPPAVAMATRRLVRDGFIRVDAAGRITLTAEGGAIAGRVLQRHHLIERMLAEVFGMEWYKVHDEAEQLEHAVSEDFERRLRERLGSEGPCPHGNLLTNDTPRDRRDRGLLPLAELKVGTAARVIAVFERDRSLLEYLDRLGLRPGISFRKVAHNYDETVAVESPAGSSVLGPSAAEKVWVQPAV
jgi:DtxR family Mn-dependent transcriptional regulator